jgi:hypothetical protein
VTAGCCNLERFGAFALLVYVDGLTRLYAETWTVDSLAIYQNVAVNHHLSRL